MAGFHDKLVLSKYLLSLLGATDLEVFSKDMSSSSLEGYTEEGNSKYLDVLISLQYSEFAITKDQLKGYDENIIRYTNEISYRRDQKITWKYFQYLSLLFTEMYLDRYFSNKVKLLIELNEFVDKFNISQLEEFEKLKHNKKKANLFQVEHFVETDLQKIAFWNATGSGKTLLMHVNIKQYMHYVKAYKQEGLVNKIILITPNEGLTNQHNQEFYLSDIPANVFSRHDRAGMYSGEVVEIIDIHKLAENDGDKTFAVGSFETNNLVLVDEGHGGMNGDTWKDFRDSLSESGFAFEYSATFGQAINAATASKKKNLEQEYSKSILFDYSYKYFYNDGYGKDYKILNLNADANSVYARLYLTANLISYYQQLLLYKDKPSLASQFQLHKPLWVFVGGSVNAVKEVTIKVGDKSEKRKTSDVLEIINFITEFLKNITISINDIASIISDEAGLLDTNGKSIFQNSFYYLIELGLSAKEIFDGINKYVFNSSVLGANLYVDNLKGANGELGLRVGESDYFGVINVGDEGNLHKLVLENKIMGGEKDFSESLFDTINKKESKINLLIGSKKFSEGWSSWRVSSMGLMNVGKSEGSQIIQLFGRGVRLKGYNFSLKRSKGLDEFQKPEKINEYKNYLSSLETLNVFGVKADYMEKFKDFLEQEGLPPNDSDWVEIDIPVSIKKDSPISTLKMIKVKDSEDFKMKVLPLVLDLNKTVLAGKVIEIDKYPKIQQLSTEKSNTEVTKYETILSSENICFLDWNKIYIEILRYKAEKRYSNLSIEKEKLIDIALDKSWYKIFIPAKELMLSTFTLIPIWEGLVLSLLKNYIDIFYNYHKNEFNAKHIESRYMSDTDDNFVKSYSVLLNTKEEIDTIKLNLESFVGLLKSADEYTSKKLGNNFVVFDNIQHLYKPLFSLDSNNYKNKIQVSPIGLDQHEKMFLDDLTKDIVNRSEFYADKDVYVLRNQSRKGIGFFADGNNFYPDFILWILKDEKQYISFIDPKGIRNSKGLNDPKIQFHNVIKKKIQHQVEDEGIVLNSFILSNTRYIEIQWKDKLEIEDFNNNNIYFQQEDKENYIQAIITKTLEDN